MHASTEAGEYEDKAEWPVAGENGDLARVCAR